MIGLAPTLAVAHLVPMDGETLADFLDRYLPPLPPPMTAAEAVERALAGCACGNPAVTRDAPCAACGCVPIPTRVDPAACPYCGARTVVVEWWRDLLRGEIVFRYRCHGAAAQAVLPDAQLRTLDHEARMVAVAAKVAEAIAGLAHASRPAP